MLSASMHLLSSSLDCVEFWDKQAVRNAAADHHMKHTDINDYRSDRGPDQYLIIYFQRVQKPRSIYLVNS